MKRPVAAALTLVLVTLSAGCRSAEPTGEIATVTNNTYLELAVIAFEDGSLVDPIPFLEPGTFEEYRVRRGERHPIDQVPGWESGDGLTLFIYVVNTSGAIFTTSMPVTGSQLSQSKGEIRIKVIPAPREVNW